MRFGLLPRLVAVAACCAAEWTLISTTFHPAVGGHVLAWFLVPFCSVFAALGSSRVVNTGPADPAFVPGPLRWRFVAAHAAALALFAWIAAGVPGGGAAAAVPVVALYVTAFLSIAFAVLAVVPLDAGVRLMRRTGNVWIYAAVAGIVAWRLVFLAASLWDARPEDVLAGVTFRAVGATLSSLLPGIAVNPAVLRITTPRFRVLVGGACSGIEGLGLMLVFTATWLWFFRREIRFPQALILVPAALALSWCANVARIVVLVLIGHFGAPNVAVGGFHSQAGWLTFNVVAVGFVLAAGRVPWLSRTAARRADAATVENPVAAYVAPFTAILAASLVARLLSGGFEWLYPLRFVAGAAVLWHFRAAYRSLEWRVGWQALLAGAVAFALWIAADALQGAATDVFPSALASASPFARIAWIVLRAAAAIVTVPIAEELAFRGYLARRFVSADFDAVSLRALTPFAIAASSIAFGVMHGRQWLVATVVGLLYAAALRRRGSLGDAAAAHAVTNALLAGWVLTRGAWHLW